MNGRRYRLCSARVGTHAASVRTSRSIASTKICVGSSGSASRLAERWKRAAFYVLIALDWLALNSTPVRDKIKQARTRVSIPPGAGR